MCFEILEDVAMQSIGGRIADVSANDICGRRSGVARTERQSDCYTHNTQCYNGSQMQLHSCVDSIVSPCLNYRMRITRYWGSSTGRMQAQ